MLQNQNDFLKNFYETGRVEHFHNKKLNVTIDLTHIRSKFNQAYLSDININKLDIIFDRDDWILADFLIENCYINYVNVTFVNINNLVFQNIISKEINVRNINPRKLCITEDSNIKMLNISEGHYQDIVCSNSKINKIDIFNIQLTSITFIGNTHDDISIKTLNSDLQKLNILDTKVAKQLSINGSQSKIKSIEIQNSRLKNISLENNRVHGFQLLNSKEYKWRYDKIYFNNNTIEEIDIETRNNQNITQFLFLNNKVQKLGLYLNSLITELNINCSTKYIDKLFLGNNNNLITNFILSGKFQGEIQLKEFKFKKLVFEEFVNENKFNLEEVNFYGNVDEN